MNGKRVICLGDSTDHGGKVVSAAQAKTTVNGRPVVTEGDLVFCPQCKGTFPITEGSQAMSFQGRGVVYEGMKTACGAILFASSDELVIKS
ncbi:TPA: PAAR domain-containing protein [Morganella morganii]|nr:PAAR domain-containing protein [Morganella morganii]